MELKDKILSLRKKYNLTYEEIADKVGVGKSTVRKWETGAILNIRRDKISKLAEALNTTEEYLLGIIPNESGEKAENFGFYKVASVSPKLKVANPTYNVGEIEKLIDIAVKGGAQILVAPELCLTGYTCADLFHQKSLINACNKALAELLRYTQGTDMLIVVGMPIEAEFSLYNCAVVINKGEILGVVPKEYIPNSADSYEKRWFASGNNTIKDTVSILDREVPFGKLLFKVSDDCTVGIEIGSDLWAAVPPSSLMALNGANLILNLTATSEAVSKTEYIESLVKGQSARCICGYVLASAGVCESTTDSVFSGLTLIAENGKTVSSGKRFIRDNVITFGCLDMEKINALRKLDTGFADSALNYKTSYKTVSCSVKDFVLSHFDGFVDPHPFIPSDKNKKKSRCENIINMQAAGLAKRLEHTGMKKCVVGISGGLDSTLALLIADRTVKLLGLPSYNIIGITMPGFGTTDRTYNNALELMRLLGITVKEISIKDACLVHFKDIGHDVNIHDVTYENAQARERTQILMDVANKEGGLLVGTGDLSEIAMGWCTYNGDHMSMYGVNADVPKTLVRYLVEYIAGISDKKVASILLDIVDTPVSPELLPPDKSGNIAQKTEDNIGPYELHDFFLYHFFRYGFTKEKIAFLARHAFMGQYTDEIIDKWLNSFLRRFFISQFKRSCVPDGVKIGSVALSPRGDLKMPSDTDFSEWLK